MSKIEIDPAALADLDAEQAVIGSCLISSSASDSAVLDLTPAMFSSPINREIFGQIAGMKKEGRTVDIVTLRAELNRVSPVASLHGQTWLEYIGGESYLIQCAESVASPSNCAEYCAIVRESYAKRQVVKLAEAAIRGVNDGVDADQLAADLQFGCSKISTGRSVVMQAKEIMMDDDWAEPKEYVKTGISSIDSYLNGVPVGYPTVIGARPGVGKTVMMAQIAEYSASTGKRVLFATYEMPQEDILKIMLAGASDQSELYKYVGETLFFYDPYRGNDDTVEHLVKEAMQVEPSLIMVDYLQLLRTRQKHGSEHLRIGGIMGELRVLARRMKIPIIIGSQLSRGVDKRESHKPNMGDLRESGDIEAASANVLLLSKPALYDETLDQNKLEVIVGKSRFLQPSRRFFDLYFDPNRVKFDGYMG